MSTSVTAVIQAATIWRGRNFSQAGYGANPYCASFVRWCFERATGTNLGLPMVRTVPYYVRKGIHVTAGPWFADSLAGDEVGPVVNSQQPGDLVFFRDTADGPWPRGSITHIGIALDRGDIIADAGSGSLVHFRSHRATFPGLVVEVRRPKVLGASHAENVYRSAIMISHGHAFGMARGKHSNNITMHLVRSAGRATAAASPSGQTGTMAMMMSGYGAGGGGGGHGKIPNVPHRVEPKTPHDSQHFHWDVSVNGQIIKPVHSVQADIVYGGNHFKLFAHDHKGQGFMNGAPLAGAMDLKVTLQNGAAHVWIDGREVKPEHAEIEIMG